MKIEIVKAQEKLTEDKVSEVEAKHQISFPKEYRAFMLQFNGGQPKPNNFTFGDQAYCDSCVKRFLSVSDGISGSLEAYIDLFKVQVQRLPDNLVPIAIDPGGNLICIAVSGADRGAVYFWDHEHELDEEQNTFLIANDFNEFLSKLT